MWRRPSPLGRPCRGVGSRALGRLRCMCILVLFTPRRWIKHRRFRPCRGRLRCMLFRISIWIWHPLLGRPCSRGVARGKFCCMCILLLFTPRRHIKHRRFRPCRGMLHCMRMWRSGRWSGVDFRARGRLRCTFEIRALHCKWVSYISSELRMANNLHVG